MPVWVPATAGGPIDDGSRLELVVIVGGDLAVFMAVEDGSETEGSAEDFVEAEVKTTSLFFLPLTPALLEGCDETVGL